MGDQRLASAGDDIKLWNCNGYGLVQQFNPHSHNVSAVCWSRDNNSVASASTSGDKIVLTFTGGKTPSFVYDLAVGEGRQCIAFNSMSRYIMGGGPDGIVHVWDLKSHKLKRSYEDHKGPITSIQFNWNDTVIASGSETGQIILYNVVNGLASSPLVSPKSQSVRQVRYSHFKKSLLASCSDSGAVCLWDTNKRQLFHSYTDSHTAPATGLAFSPINDMLLMSAGLDKRIICFDVHNKMPVKTMVAESPLTSIDIRHDGSTLAVGSTRGKVYIYDLRHGQTPLQTIAAHKSSVQCLQFQSARDKAGTGGTDSPKKGSVATTNNNNVNIKAPATNGEHTGLKVEKGSHLKPSSSPALRKSLSPAPMRDFNAREQENYEAEVFSPIRDRFGEKYNHYNRNDSLLRRAMTPGPVKSTYPVEKQQRRALTPGPSKLSVGGNASLEARLDGTGKSNHSYDGMADPMFSPLLTDGAGVRSHPIGGAAADNNTTTTTSTAAHQPTYGSPLLRDRTHQPPPAAAAPAARDQQHNNNRDMYLDGLANNHHNLNSGEHSSQESLLDSSFASQDGAPQGGPSVRQSPGPSRHRRSPSREAVDQAGAAAAGAMIDYPAASSSLAVTPDGAAPSGGASGGGFPAAFVRNVVAEAMEEVREQIRQDVLNLHMDMLKQFQKQQAETRALLQEYSVNNELLAEIERLREENKRLKQTF